MEIWSEVKTSIKLTKNLKQTFSHKYLAFWMNLSLIFCLTSVSHLELKTTRNIPVELGYFSLPGRFLTSNLRESTDSQTLGTAFLFLTSKGSLAKLFLSLMDGPHLEINCMG